MTDAELRDAAVAELKLTTAGWRKRNGAPNYPSGVAPDSTHWGKAMKLLEQIGAVTPPPPAGNLQRVITAGGAYSGAAVGDASSPAVTIQTTAPVVIESARIENLQGGYLIRCQGAVSLTVRHTVFEGALGGRAIYTEGFKSLEVMRSDFNRTGGIDLRWPVAGATVKIHRNRCLNTSMAPPAGLRQFLQFNDVKTVAQALVEWNEIVNEYGKSGVEDAISVFKTNNVLVRNNYIEGGYPAHYSQEYSGTGIMLGDYGGSNNTAEANIVVGNTNLGISIVAGQNNKILSNIVISDGKLPDGTPLAGANNGIVCYDNGTGGGAFGGHTVSGNKVGAMHSGNPPYRNDYWLPGAAVTSGNTSYPNPLTHQMELDAKQIWLQRLQANGVVIGV